MCHLAVSWFNSGSHTSRKDSDPAVNFIFQSARFAAWKHFDFSLWRIRVWFSGPTPWKYLSWCLNPIRRSPSFRIRLSSLSRLSSLWKGCFAPLLSILPEWKVATSVTRKKPHSLTFQLKVKEWDFFLGVCQLVMNFKNRSREIYIYIPEIWNTVYPFCNSAAKLVQLTKIYLI